MEIRTTKAEPCRLSIEGPGNDLAVKIIKLVVRTGLFEQFTQLAKLVDFPLEFPLYERRERVFSVLDAISSEKMLPANALMSAFSFLYRLNRAVGWWRRYFVFLRLKVKGELVGNHQVFRKQFKQA